MATDQYEDDIDIDEDIVDDDDLAIDVIDDEDDVDYDGDYDDVEEKDEADVVDVVDVEDDEEEDEAEDDGAKADDGGEASDDDDDDDVDLDDDDEEEDEETLEVLLGPDSDAAPTPMRTRTDDSGDAPPGEGEFTCRSCFLVKRRPQLADADAMICLDCA